MYSQLKEVRMKTVIVILAAGFEEIETITPIDMLKRAGANVQIVGVGGTQITGSHGITVTCDTTVSEIIHQPVDCVILPGGMPGTTNLLESNDVLNIVRSNHRENKLIAAICAAPRILDKAGILEGKEYTCYPSAKSEIIHGIHRNSPVITDGNVITGRAAGSVFDFSNEVISHLFSQDIMREVSDKIVYKAQPNQ
jgi:protein deglycase